MVDDLWWTLRLDEWAEDGLEISAMADLLTNNSSSASKLLLEFEELVKLNRKLFSRITKSKLKSIDEQAWLAELKDPLNTKIVEEEWLDWADINCPWEPVALYNEDIWHSEEKFAFLDQIIDRLSELDISSHPSVYPFIGLIAEPKNMDTLDALIGDVELDEVRRRKIIVEMIEMLSEYGVDAEKAAAMPIMEALEFLDSLQVQVETNQKINLLISREISPFDPELGELLLEGGVEDLEEKVLTISDNFNSRLDSLNALYSKWRTQGILLPFDSNISAEDSLDHEAGLHEMDDLVNIHLDLISRWSHFNKFWPDLSEKGNDFVGFLESTEEFADFVEELEQEWRSLELDAGELIEKLSQNGFVMDRWKVRIEQDPRSAISWLRDESSLYDRAIILIEELRRLDVSLDKDDSIETRVAYLKEIEIDSETLLEMADFIDRKSRRNARHRILLEREWRSLKNMRMVSDQNTASLNLAEFEQLIETAATGRDSSLSTERLFDKMQSEIDAWSRSGVDVGDLQDILDNSPSELAQKIIAIRDDVARHSLIRKRLQLLPWSRDPALSVEVNLDLTKPQKLASLDANIPQLAKRLLSSTGENEDFEFIPWKPSSSDRPILIPVSPTTNTHEDAMEAILEEMEDNQNSKSSPQEEVMLEEKVPVKELEPKEEIKEESPPVILKPNITVLPAEIVLDDVESEDLNESVFVDTQDNSVDLESQAKEEIAETIQHSDIADSKDYDAEFLEVLGIHGAEAGSLMKVIASEVGHEPRDMRVDRLLRLALRAINPDIPGHQRGELLNRLTGIAKSLSEWTAIRLSARNKGSGEGLLPDSAELGVALNRIPGPGISIPLSKDNLALPPTNDIVGLNEAIRKLERVSTLPVAGGIR